MYIYIVCGDVYMFMFMLMSLQTIITFSASSTVNIQWTDECEGKHVFMSGTTCTFPLYIHVCIYTWFPTLVIMPSCKHACVRAYYDSVHWKHTCTCTYIHVHIIMTTGGNE